MPDSFVSSNTHDFSNQFWYQAGKVYLYYQNRFVVVSDNLGEDWGIIDSPDGSQVGHRQVQFTERGIHWNLPSGYWFTPYENPNSPTLIFVGNLNNTTALHSGDYNCYSTAEGVYLQSPDFPEPELRDDGISGPTNNFYIFGKTWWAYSNGLLYRSADEGITWEREQLSLLMGQYDRLTIFADFGDVLYLRQDEIIYVSSDDGYNWTPISTVPFATEVTVSKTDGEIYIYNENRLLYSSDGINFSENVRPEGFDKIIAIEDQLYAFGFGTRSVSSDHGVNWTPKEMTYGRSRQPEIYQDGKLWSINEIFHPEKNITISNDVGKTWVEHVVLIPYQSGISSYHWMDLAFADTTLVFLRGGDRLYSTANLGDEWGQIPGPNTTNADPVNTQLLGEYLYTKNFAGQFFRTPLASIQSQLSDTIFVQNQISGFLYKDDNGNCTFDGADQPVTDKVITLGDRTTTTDEDGWYGIFHTAVDTIAFYTDSIRHHLLNCEFTKTGDKILSGDSADTLSIAFNPIPNVTDAGITVFPRGVFRPGGACAVSVIVTNFGTETITNELLKFRFNPGQGIVTGNTAVNLVNDSTWQVLLELQEGEEREYYIPLSLSQGLSLEDTLNYQLEIPIPEDVYQPDNMVNLEVPVLSAFDPNDKTVFPATTPRPGETTELVYRIRFQNTGTDTALNVTVIDTLSENLNVYSLRMLEASHEYDLQIDAGNIVRWNFKNILLPDSTTNEPDSHGFIYFKINTNNDLIDGDQISNLAAIYFDYNDPILTNRVITEIKDVLINTEDLTSPSFTATLQPNPVSQSTQLVFELEKPELLEVSLHNKLGQKVKTVLSSSLLPSGFHTLNLSLADLSTGVYFITIKSAERIKTLRVMKVE